MITLAQAKAWHPCNRSSGEQYDDAHLEVLFAGEPASWERVASWDIPRGDVVWLATRHGAIDAEMRHYLCREASALVDEEFACAELYGKLVVEEEEEERCEEMLQKLRSSAAFYRDMPEVGWWLATREDARAMEHMVKAHQLWAAALAWELCTIGASSGGMTWAQQVAWLVSREDIL